MDKSNEIIKLFYLIHIYMTFEDTIINRLKKKNVADSTINLYVGNLRKLNDSQIVSNLSFLKNIDDILSKISHFKPNTKKQYLISIISVLNSYKDIKQHTALANKYYNHLLALTKYINETPSSTLSDAQKKNWISWKEVTDIWNTYRDAVKSFASKKNIDDEQYNILLSFVVLSLYVLNPPRRNKDYLNMMMIKKYNDNDYPDKYNYYDYSRGNFIFNQYKTARTYSRQIIPVSPELNEILHTYIQFHPMYPVTSNITPLLVRKNGGPLDQNNSITRILNNIFQKRIGSSMLRHIYLTGKYKQENDERQEDAKNMGHSTAQQSEYIKDA